MCRGSDSVFLYRAATQHMLRAGPLLSQGRQLAAIAIPTTDRSSCKIDPLQGLSVTRIDGLEMRILFLLPLVTFYDFELRNLDFLDSEFRILDSGF